MVSKDLIWTIVVLINVLPVIGDINNVVWYCIVLFYNYDVGI